MDKLIEQIANYAKISFYIFHNKGCITKARNAVSICVLLKIIASSLSFEWYSVLVNSNLV